MGFLQDKTILITGLLSARSIAYGIATAARREGARLAFTYQSQNVKDRVLKLANEFASDLVFPCDVASDGEIDQLFASLATHWDGLDGIVHSIAFAPREQLDNDYLDSVTREGFRIAHEVSSYSLAALAKAGAKMMLGRNGSILTLSYLGAVRSVPHYNVMGLAKASLEANVRYMAQSLGPKGIRVNGISAGPIKTLAAAGIADFSKLLGHHAKHAPLRRNTTIEEVGNAAAFLLSDLSSGMTGEIMYVDGGFNTTALGLAD
jgi:enoyl-[acyl-carrier protein] reductase I